MTEPEVYEHQTPLTSVYGRDAPDAAKFGKGAQSIEQVRDAAQKRRDLPIGQYGTR